MYTPAHGGFTSCWRLCIPLFLMLGLLCACQVKSEAGSATFSTEIHPTDPASMSREAQQNACISPDNSAVRYPLGTGVVINLPDGGGLILCDSSGDLTSELSTWNLFISDVNIMTADNAAFVIYSYDTDPVMMHGARIDLTQMMPVWRSEENSDFSAFMHTSAIEVSASLDTFKQICSASGTVDFIRDEVLTDIRYFSLDWYWDGQSYQLVTSPNMFATYEQFLANIAIDSPLESVVQFVKAVRNGDMETALSWSSGDEVYRDAILYGLDVETRVYEIVSLSDSMIELRDEMSMLTFEIISEDERFLVASMYPSQGGE